MDQVSNTSLQSELGNEFLWDEPQIRWANSANWSGHMFSLQTYIASFNFVLLHSRVLFVDTWSMPAISLELCTKIVSLDLFICVFDLVLNMFLPDGLLHGSILDWL